MGALVLLLGVGLRAQPAAALEVQVKELRAPASVVTATIELRDLLPDRFTKTLDAGGILHLRVQAELWESRPVWDRLVYPSIVRVFRFRRASGSSLSITDPSGSATTVAAAPRAMPVSLELGNTNRVTSRPTRSAMRSSVGNRRPTAWARWGVSCSGPC